MIWHSESGGTEHGSRIEPRSVLFPDPVLATQRTTKARSAAGEKRCRPLEASALPLAKLGLRSELNFDDFAFRLRTLANRDRQYPITCTGNDIVAISVFG